MKPIIIQFDFDENYHTVADIVCYGFDLEIYQHVNSIADAKLVLEKIKKGELKLDYAIISQILGNDFQDGMKLSSYLRELSPKTKIIAYTINNEVEWGDYLALKTSKEITKTLVAVFEEITGKTFKISNVK